MNEETKQFIAQHRTSDTRTLALQAARYPAVDMREAITQIEGWQAAKNKLPEWAATEEIIYPPRISMEQCSSETTALYKASLVQGTSIADLTGGFGIDCSYMSRKFTKAIYIERNTLLCDIARHNFSKLGLLHTTIINGESEEALLALPQQDWIFIDPARRDGDGRKVVALADCTPDVTAMENVMLQKSHKVMIKCSPMLDIKAASRELRNISEIHIVAVGNECKELLFILSGEGASTPPIHCINITNSGNETFTFTAREEEKASVNYAKEVHTYIYEPNAAIQKGGCYKALANVTGTEKLHPNSQLFTADRLIPDFPGRRFKVEKVFGFTKREIKEISSIGKANITVRNFPDSVQMLRKRLKLSEGGNDYLFATTTADERKVIILCHSV